MIEEKEIVCSNCGYQIIIHTDINKILIPKKCPKCKEEKLVESNQNTTNK